jgi:hypothetical protein
VSSHASNSIIKFADDTTVVGLITNNDETAYSEEVRALGEWCQENNLSFNVNKTKKLTSGKQQKEHAPIHIDGTGVDKVESFKFFGVHITNDLKWSTHTDNVVNKVLQRLFNLRRLKKFGLSPLKPWPKRHSRKSTTRATACSPHYYPEGEVSWDQKLRPRDSFYLKAIRLLNSHH